ncbi:transporter small conductance mechanosensitive ion channel (MscS) family [Klebsiella pneumoniae]|uniref:Transporter small conductance mechanosensitive ion channel (MscS) family n=1 Tax=Klebsiella pneumoniae TaxID=573 RepID=A0A378C7E2_KLEPN|nr:transporter small conductance mechanosensitive ion channel (MscS) family [Klebsiella pneumoniae]
MAANALHSSIIDVFNEFGVQIMSPNFVMQPKAAVVVPQEAWYAARPSRRRSLRNKG